MILGLQQLPMTLISDRCPEKILKISIERIGREINILRKIELVQYSDMARAEAQQTVPSVRAVYTLLTSHVPRSLPGGLPQSLPLDRCEATQYLVSARREWLDQADH
jgi:hypothetical protein